MRALTTGTMQVQGAKLSVDERRAIAEFLTRRTISDAGPASAVGRCATSPPLADPARSPRWNGWGVDVTNTRFQPAAQAGLSASDVPKLELKWAFGFPDATSAWSQPVVAAGRVFVGSQNGHVYSLDAKTGCTHWSFAASAAVRSAISIAPRPDAGATGAYTAYFGDMAGSVYALDAATGALLWKRRVDDHQIARITGAPTLHEGPSVRPRLLARRGVRRQSQYECCTFRGSVAALDVRTGSVLWKTYAFDEPRPIGKSSTGVVAWGPSGAGIGTRPPST